MFFFFFRVLLLDGFQDGSLAWIIVGVEPPMTLFWVIERAAMEGSIYGLRVCLNVVPIEDVGFSG